MTDPAITVEYAHQARREGRAEAAAEAWPHECRSDCAPLRRYRATLERIARESGERHVLMLANDALDAADA